MLAAKLESGAKRVKRSFGRNIPFEAETRSKRQAVSATLPKVLAPPSPSGSSSSASASSSPCAEDCAPDARPVYVRESRLSLRSAALAQQQQQQQQHAADLQCNKNVQFLEGTKAWNGLRRDRHFMDQLLHEFFVLGRQFASVDVLRLTGLDAALVGGVLALLEDLCARVKAGSMGDEDGVPVLLEGGGRGMKVSLFHHPYLQSLKRVVAEAEHIAGLKMTIGEAAPQEAAPQEAAQQEAGQQEPRVQELPAPVAT